MSNNNFKKLGNTVLNNNEALTSKVIESGIFFISTTPQGSGAGLSAYTTTDLPVRWTKTVDEVTLVFSSDSVLRTSVVANNVTYVRVPENLRPIDEQVFDIILGSDNNAGQYLIVAILPDGTIVMGNGGSVPSTGNPFTAGSNLITGPYAFSMTYYTGRPRTAP
jgi:hypothetical protein